MKHDGITRAFGQLGQGERPTMRVASTVKAEHLPKKRFHYEGTPNTRYRLGKRQRERLNRELYSMRVRPAVPTITVSS